MSPSSRKAKPGAASRALVPSDSGVPAAADSAPRNSPRSRRRLDGRKVMVRFVGLATRLPAYVKLGWLLARDPAVPGWGKAALAGALGYVVSPIDPLPGIIPVIGQLDDLAVLLLAVRGALAAAPEEVARQHLSTTGLSREQLERDLLTLRATAVWIAGRAGALAGLAARTLARALASRLRFTRQHES